MSKSTKLRMSFYDRRAYRERRREKVMSNVVAAETDYPMAQDVAESIVKC